MVKTDFVDVSAWVETLICPTLLKHDYDRPTQESENGHELFKWLLSALIKSDSTELCCPQVSTLLDCIVWTLIRTKWRVSKTSFSSITQISALTVNVLSGCVRNGQETPNEILPPSVPLIFTKFLHENFISYTYLTIVKFLCAYHWIVHEIMRLFQV